MTTFRNVLNKIFAYSGGAATLALLAGLLGSSAFLELESSFVIMLFTVIFLFCGAVGVAGLYSKCGLAVDAEKSGANWIFPVTLVSVLAVCVRATAFILTDVSMLESKALWAYLFAVINTVFIFLIVKKLWHGRSGIIGAIIYALWGSFEILTVLNISARSNMLLFFGAQSVTLLSIWLLFSSISSKNHNLSIFLCVLSGIFGGAAAGAELSFVIFFVPSIIYLLTAKARLRSKKYWTKKPCAIKPAFFTLCYLLCFAFAFCGVGLTVAIVFDKVNCHLINDISFVTSGSVLGFFTESDNGILKTLSLVGYPRNYFAGYCHVCGFIMLLALCAIGCFAAGKRRDGRASYFSVVILLIVLISILGGGNGYFALLLMPYLVILGVFGMNSTAEFLVMYEWFFKGGEENPAFAEEYLFVGEKVSADETGEDPDDRSDVMAEGFVEFSDNTTETEVGSALQEDKVRDDKKTEDDIQDGTVNDNDSNGDVPIGDKQDDLLASLAKGLKK